MMRLCNSLGAYALAGMARPEEYRERAKRAREEAKACRNEWERQRLILIADQLEQIADIKELTSVRPDHADNNRLFS
jgi:hypothetical protein